MSTVAEFVTTDYRMENCELQILLPPTLSPNMSIDTSSENVIEIWLLDSPQQLYAKTLTWANRPQRKTLIDRIKMELGLQYSYNFTCPLNSFWTFELSAGDGNGDTYVEWTQDWYSPTPRMLCFFFSTRRLNVTQGLRYSSMEVRTLRYP